MLFGIRRHACHRKIFCQIVTGSKINILLKNGSVTRVSSMLHLMKTLILRAIAQPAGLHYNHCESVRPSVNS